MRRLLRRARRVAGQRCARARVVRRRERIAPRRPSDGVALTLHADSGVSGRALRMDVDYQGHAGYAVARRAFSLPPLPAHWALTLWVRGDAKPNTLEIKLVDSSGPERVVDAASGAAGHAQLDDASLSRLRPHLRVGAARRRSATRHRRTRDRVHRGRGRPRLARARRDDRRPTRRARR